MENDSIPDNAASEPADASDEIGQTGKSGKWCHYLAWGLSLVFLSFLTYQMLLFGPLAKLTSLDGPWHLNVGRIIYETGTVPRQDTICFTSAKLDWVNLNWLSQLALYKLYLLFGYLGPQSLTLIAYLLTFLLLSDAMRRRNCRAIFALPALLCFALVLVLSFYTIRPRTLSYVLFAAVASILALPDPQRRFNWRRSAGLLLIMMVWNQLHGGFVYGYALIALDALGASFDERLTRGGWINRRSVLLSSIVALGGLALGLLHPHHLAAIDHVAHYSARVAEFHDVVTELIPLDMSQELGVIVEFVIIVALLLGPIKGRSVRWQEIIPLLVFLHFTFNYVRVVPMFLLIALPWLVSLMSTSLDRRDFAKLPIVVATKILDQGLSVTWRIVPSFLILTIGVWLFIVLPLLAKPGTAGEVRELMDGNRHPVQAVEFLLEHRDLKGRIFNHYNFGGVLGWALYPEQRVFIDGRGDLHARGPTFQDYQNITKLDPNWKDKFDSYQIDLVFDKPNSLLSRTLKQRYRWKSLYEDEQACILQKQR